MSSTQHGGSRPPYQRTRRVRWYGALLALALLALAGCRAASEPPATESPRSPSSQPAATLSPTRTATAQPAAAGTRAMDSAAATARSATAATPVAVPILGDQLAAGWDTQASWSTQFERQDVQGSGESAPASGAVYKATFFGESSGLFLAVKQDSPARYLIADIVEARVWINPGAEPLSADHLKLAVLSSDRRAHWDISEQPVPFDPRSAAGETPLPAPDGRLPANTWTRVAIRLDELPSRPDGRYLTGLYLKAEQLPGRAILLSQLELLVTPDDTQPEARSVSQTDDVTLRVTFSKDVDPVSAENPANYRVSSARDPAYGSPKSPASAKYEPESMSVTLVLPEPLQPGVDYAVEVTRIADLAPQPRRQAAPATLTFTATVLTIKVDLETELRPISPYIYGIAPPTGADAQKYMQALRPRLSNWGGNPTTRYNWELGNAFNAGSDWEYRNTDYGNKSRSVTDQFVADAQAVGADVRITLPTLGWVAKNTDSNTCSFIGKDGKCYNPGATCQKPGPVADPNKTSVKVDESWAVRWVKHLLDEKDFNVRFFAMDNEPDLWGFTHYDAHPNCSTYEEILNKYLTYATAVRAVAPQAELLGPVSCCWHFYWNSPAGDADKAKHGNKDFLPWFLEQVRLHDQKAGVRTLDALDIHYYPENVYNDKDDPETAAARLEATRGLWDGNYVDPSWIAQPVRLIPRMKQLIEENYPGTKLFLSEWNFGGDKSMSGALAIADALGIFGQEELYAASYYQQPELNSPGFFGFKMFTNYDDKGGRFGDIALPAASSNRRQVAAYAARDSETGKVTIMLINKLPGRALPMTLQLSGFSKGEAELYRYGQDKPEGIARERIDLTDGSTLLLPPYSITLLVIPQEGQ